MTRKTPKDPALNKLVRELVNGKIQGEQVIFIDTNNQIREAIYPSEFGNGILDLVRKRLEGLGVLKAVLHVSVAAVTGSRGPQVSVLEYLPDGQYYGYLWQPTTLRPTPPSEVEEALERTKQLFHDTEVRRDEEGE